MRIVFSVYALLFEAVLSVVMIGLACVAMTGDVVNFRLPMLSWEGATLAHAVLALGILGLVVVALAAMGLLRWLLPIWAVAVVILLIRGWFASPYTFSGSSGFETALWITIAAFLAFLCSFAVLLRRPRKF